MYFINTSGNYEGPYLIADNPSEKKYILSHNDGNPAKKDQEIDEDKLVAVDSSSSWLQSLVAQGSKVVVIGVEIWGSGYADESHCNRFSHSGQYWLLCLGSTAA